MSVSRRREGGERTPKARKRQTDQQQQRAKGFGAPSPPQPGRAPQKSFESDELDEGLAMDDDSFAARSEYQIYTDADYKPKRFIGPVELQRVKGGA